MTKLEAYLQEVEERVGRAAEGPWKAIREIRHDWTSTGEPTGMSIIDLPGCDPQYFDTPDAEFIAHSRTDVPKLVALLNLFMALSTWNYDLEMPAFKKNIEAILNGEEK